MMNRFRKAALKQPLLAPFLLFLASASAGASTATCKPVTGLLPVLAPKSILLLGEMHGSQQAPAFTANAVCWASASALPVRVGLEIPENENESIQRYLGSKGTQEDKAALLSTSFWTRDYQDGRSSQAMAELIEEIRRLRSSGAEVDIFLFDSLEFSKNRDRQMAERLIRKISRDNDHQWIVLTGNVHSRIVPGVPWDKDFETMGTFLKRDLKKWKITALNLGYSGGSTWVCRGSKAEDCGPREVRESPGHEGGWKVSLDANPPRKDGHDGVYSVGALSPSPPAARPEQSAVAASE